MIWVNHFQLNVTWKIVEFDWLSLGTVLRWLVCDWLIQLRGVLTSPTDWLAI